MIYFIQAGHNGPIKIGFSSRPRKRLRQMQTANARPLRLLGTIPTTSKGLEAEIHHTLRKHKRRGEWFRPHHDVLHTLSGYQASAAAAKRVASILVARCHSG